MLNRTPKRKATNLTLDQALVAEAKELDINVSRVAEEAIDAAIAARKAELWLAENRAAIDQNNRYFAEHGLPFQDLRKY